MKANTLLSQVIGLFIGFLSLPGSGWAQSGNQPYIRFMLFTGGDDLRNGQNVTVSLYPNLDLGNFPNFLNVNMNQGRGSASNTSFYYDFPLGNGWKPTSFRAFKILHDGNGHNAFEGYDNWNLDRIRVMFVDPNASPRQTVLLDLSGQPLVRFTGDKRGQSWNLNSQTVQNSSSPGVGSVSGKRPMSDWTVSDIRMSQHNTVDDPLETMLVKIRQAGTFQTMSTAQARRIVESFRGDAGRLSLARACYQLVLDRDQFPTLVDLFSTSVGQFETAFGKMTGSPSTSQATNASMAVSRPVQDPESRTRIASGEIKGKFIRVRYGQLAVKGRDVWSTISPYGQIWRTGSNEATTITFDRDVVVGWKTPIPAGTYSLFTIPGPTNWTIILNRNNRLWGTQGYSPNEDVIRHSEDPRPHDYTEQLTFEVISDGVMLRWERVEIFIPIE